MQLIICKITSVFPQTLIRYILKQDLPMSLEDSLTLAEAYKLPTSQINYLYVIHLIGQGKVCKSSQEVLIACYWLILLFCVPDIFVWDFCTVFFADWGNLDSPEEAALCRGRVCDWASHIVGQDAAGGQRTHIWWGTEGKTSPLWKCILCLFIFKVQLKCCILKEFKSF